jgi:hypothetical protein
MADDRVPATARPHPERDRGLAGSDRSIEEIDSLARELGPLARDHPDLLKDRLAALSVRGQAELALRLPAPERLELLLHAPKPMQLVRALPDAELYLTVRELGPADALPLLALTSSSQLTHLLDLESWRRDRFDADRAGAWAAVLVEAGEPVVRRFLRNTDDEVLVLLFRDWARVEQIPIDDAEPVHGHGETEAGTELGFVSPDGSHRFAPTIPGHAPAVRRMAEVFFHDQRERYARVLWAALWELPSELEEQALQFRQSRLEEHGFPPWEDALTIYAPPEGIVSHPQPLEPPTPDGLSSPRAPIRVLAGVHPLAAVVDSLEGPSRDRVLHELVSVANHVLVADASDTGDPAAHRAALRKAAGYVEIGLAARGARDARAAQRVVTELPLAELFREGYSLATALQGRARVLLRERKPIDESSLKLLDVTTLQRVRGLAKTRPLYFDEKVALGEPSFRDFRSLEEIETTRAALDRAVESLPARDPSVP